MSDTLKIQRWNRSRGPDEAELARQLEQEGYHVFRWTDPPGRTYEPHAHGEDQSHWIISGALALTVGGTEYVLTAGDRDYLPAGTIHSARVVGETPVTYLIASK